MGERGCVLIEHEARRIHPTHSTHTAFGLHNRARRTASDFTLKFATPTSTPATPAARVRNPLRFLCVRPSFGKTPETFQPV